MSWLGARNSPKIIDKYNYLLDKKGYSPIVTDGFNIATNHDFNWAWFAGYKIRDYYNARQLKFKLYISCIRQGFVSEQF
jgi:hypothetical protein